MGRLLPTLSPTRASTIPTTTMPAITPLDKVLVTGSNGFIGHWLIRFLLERGYAVRAAVRSPDKGDALLQTFSAKLPDRAKAVEYVVVPDFTAVRAPPRFILLRFQLRADNAHGLLRSTRTTTPCGASRALCTSRRLPANPPATHR